MYRRQENSLSEGLEKDFWDCASYGNRRYSSTHILNLLGVVYYEMEDYKNAAEAFEREALYESLGGKINLSDMYSKGIGVPQDKAKAFKMKKEITDLFISNQLTYFFSLIIPSF